jgi:hypothetical protein
VYDNVKDDLNHTIIAKSHDGSDLAIQRLWGEGLVLFGFFTGENDIGFGTKDTGTGQKHRTCLLEKLDVLLLEAAHVLPGNGEVNFGGVCFDACEQVGFHDCYRLVFLVLSVFIV